MKYNLILNTDSYKASHYLQYPPGTSHISCYIESRGGQYEEVLFFGLQMFLKEYLTRTISQDNIEEAESFFKQHGLVFNRQGWQHILDEHQGILPIKIEAIPEGTVLPYRNVMAQIVNTCPQCYWLPTYIETSLLRAVWYPTTVATRSWHCKQTIKQYLERTADVYESLAFALHDFGARGASSFETAAIGGCAHLVNFSGTDTVYGALTAREYYHEPMAGYSIPAAEHSTVIAWGEDKEQLAYENMLAQFTGKGKMVAVVSDSYNIFHAIEHIWGEALNDHVKNNGGTVVIRPDSGNPVEVVNKTLEILMDKFGFTVNSKGFKVLPKFIRVIQGDGISPSMIKAILAEMEANHFSAENIAFGIGAELLQKLNRDTLEFAMKASAVKIDNEWHDVYKDPITGHEKRSKKGRLALVKTNNHYETVLISELAGRENLLSPVFENGKVLQDWKFSEIRERCDR